MPARNNRGIVTIGDVTLVVAMERFGKHVSSETNSPNNKRAVLYAVRAEGL
jgi:hypothetical protein